MHWTLDQVRALEVDEYEILVDTLTADAKK